MSSPLKAYKRANGAWGLRNQVLILPMHSALSSTARAIADGSDGAVAISHDWSGEKDNDLARIIFTLSGYASNPNIFATIFLSIGNPEEEQIIKGAQALGLTRWPMNMSKRQRHKSASMRHGAPLFSALNAAALMRSLELPPTQLSVLLAIASLS
jgi:altronate dehydratase